MACGLRARAYLRRFPEDALLERAPANELLVRIAARCAKPADAELPLAELEEAAAVAHALRIGLI